MGGLLLSGYEDATVGDLRFRPRFRPLYTSVDGAINVSAVEKNTCQYHTSNNARSALQGPEEIQIIQENEEASQWGRGAGECLCQSKDGNLQQLGAVSPGIDSFRSC